MANIVKIDIEKIDKEIADFRREIELRESLKKYAVSISLNDNGNGVLTRVPIDSTSLEVPAGLGISDFVISYLDINGRKRTRDVINAYASYTAKSATDIQNNVSNALSRLKSLRKLDSEYNKEIGSSIWFAKK